MTFATFNSRCPGCDEPIVEGDEIFLNFDGEEWVCQTCFEDEQLAIDQRELADGFGDE